jgi:hypothetical protein
MNISFGASDNVFLLYLRGQRGIESQKVPAPAGRDPEIGKEIKSRLLVKHKLAPENRDKSFAELKAIHPPPEVQADG